MGWTPARVPTCRHACRVVAPPSSSARTWRSRWSCAPGARLTGGRTGPGAARSGRPGSPAGPGARSGSRGRSSGGCDRTGARAVASGPGRRRGRWPAPSPGRAAPRPAPAAGGRALGDQGDPVHPGRQHGGVGGLQDGRRGDEDDVELGPQVGEDPLQRSRPDELVGGLGHRLGQFPAQGARRQHGRSVELAAAQGGGDGQPVDEDVDEPGPGAEPQRAGQHRRAQVGLEQQHPRLVVGHRPRQLQRQVRCPVPGRGSQDDLLRRPVGGEEAQVGPQPPDGLRPVPAGRSAPRTPLPAGPAAPAHRVAGRDGRQDGHVADVEDVVGVADAGVEDLARHDEPDDEQQAQDRADPGVQPAVRRERHSRGGGRGHRRHLDGGGPARGQRLRGVGELVPDGVGDGGRGRAAAGDGRDVEEHGVLLGLHADPVGEVAGRGVEPELVDDGLQDRRCRGQADVGLDEAARVGGPLRELADRLPLAGGEVDARGRPVLRFGAEARAVAQGPADGEAQQQRQPGPSQQCEVREQVHGSPSLAVALRSRATANIGASPGEEHIR